MNRAGTLIHGTLRDEDLIPAFHGELRARAPERAAAFDERVEAFHATGDGLRSVEDEAATAELTSDLMDALDEHAPEGHYFGSVEGDGADFGFWPTEDPDDEPPTLALWTRLSVRDPEAAERVADLWRGELEHLRSGSAGEGDFPELRGALTAALLDAIHADPEAPLVRVVLPEGDPEARRPDGAELVGTLIAKRVRGWVRPLYVLEDADGREHGFHASMVGELEETDA